MNSLTNTATLPHQQTSPLVILVIILAACITPASHIWLDSRSHDVARLPYDAPDILVGDSRSDPWHVYSLLGPFKPVGHDVIAKDQALRLTVPEANADAYVVGAYSYNLRPIKRHDAVEARYRLRLAPVAGNPRSAIVHLRIQKAAGNYDLIGESDITLDQTWRDYRIGGVATQDYNSGEANFTIQAATAKQAIDLGQGTLVDSGPVVPFGDRAPAPETVSASSAS